METTLLNNKEKGLDIFYYFNLLLKNSNIKFNREIANHINENLEEIKQIPGEKIWNEFKKLLLMPNSHKTFYLMTKTNLKYMFKLNKNLIHTFKKIKSHTQNPITLWYSISRMKANEAQEKFKLSDEENKLYQFLESQWLCNSKYQLKNLKQLVIMKKIPKEFAIEFAISICRFQDAKQLRSWDPLTNKIIKKNKE
jgi:tRNA nucleotidyltransferase/poly(A) polymerase